MVRRKQDCPRPLCGSQPTNPLLENQQQNNNTTPAPPLEQGGPAQEVVTTRFPNPPPRGSGTRVTAVIAWGKRPVPFRTRKLRPTAPMVLHPGGCGRVGHRRTTIRSRTPNHVGGPPAFKTQAPRCRQAQPDGPAAEPAHSTAGVPTGRDS